MVVQALTIFLQQTFAQTGAVASAVMFGLIRAINHQRYPIVILCFSVIFVLGASRIGRMALQPDGLSRI